MSDVGQEQDGGENGVLDPRIREQLRQAEKDRKRLEEMEAERTAMASELAFTKAGVPEDGLGALLRQAMQGETDATAIKAKAEEFGIFQQTQQQQGSQTDEELQRLSRMSGGSTQSTGGPSPADQFMAALAAIPDAQKSSRAGHEAVMDVVRQFQESNPELGVFVKGTR